MKATTPAPGPGQQCGGVELAVPCACRQLPITIDPLALADARTVQDLTPGSREHPPDSLVRPGLQRGPHVKASTLRLGHSTCVLSASQGCLGSPSPLPVA